MAPAAAFGVGALGGFIMFWLTLWMVTAHIDDPLGKVLLFVHFHNNSNLQTHLPFILAVDCVVLCLGLYS